jgi:hypothetical protein
LVKLLERKSAVRQLGEEKLIELKVKVKVTLEQATKAKRWDRGIALLFT